MKETRRQFSWATAFPTNTLPRALILSSLKRVWQIIAAKTLSHTFPTTRFTTLPLISQRCYDQTQICNAAQSATAPEKI